jgi:hypothetical protein
MRRAYRIIGIVAAVAAVGYAAFRIAPTVALTSSPMSSLLDACAEAALRKSASPVARHLPLPVESGYRVARVGTDLGPVTLVLTYRPDNGALHACRISGEIWGSDASIRDPAVSWGKARATVTAWFAARQALPGHAAPRNLTAASPDSLFVIQCPADGSEGIFLAAAPGEYGSLSEGMPEGARPVFVDFSHSANEPAQACAMVAAGGG